MTEQTTNASARTAIPTEIYIAQVDSLFQEGRTLLVGYVTVIGSILLSYWRTADLALPVTALLFTAVTIFRFLHMRAYSRARPTIDNSGAARRWEIWYGVGAASSLAILGCWCLLTLLRINDGYAQLVSFSITIAYVIGITGRNFGSGRLVNAQILSVATPMIAGLLVYGDNYYRGFAVALAMFFISVSLICRRLRTNLLDAVVSGLEFSRLAGRFDTALSNMPHGLCMFDAGLQIVVANRRFSELFCLPPELELKNRSLGGLVQKCQQVGALSKPGGDQLSDRVAARLAATETGKFSVETQDDRTLEFSVERMPGSGIVVLAEDITERKHTEAKVNRMAHYDALTGLFNRTLLQSRLIDVATRGEGVGFAVHFIDIDHFKQINDTLGHSRGDLMLQIAADRLRKVAGPLDVVARFGGDEFVVVQAQIADRTDATRFAERLLQALRMLYDIEGAQLRASASIGITLARDTEDDVERILRNADMALYAAKTAGRDGLCFFEPQMESAAIARRQMESDLRQALVEGAFEIHYQPIIDLKTRQIRVCEALLRWPHPTRGMVPPSEFIPVAEEIGIITGIDRWILRKACAQCRNWPQDVGVAVNLSAVHFAEDELPALIAQALDAAGLEPHRLEIEITETMLLHDTIRSREVLEALRRLGVVVSLDDFGTKYSGLSYLHSFPLHKIKIDQSFVRGLGEGRAMILLRGIAHMSAELGLRVTVEGIESAEQLAMIAGEPHIHEAQGYLFARPMPGPALRRLFDAAAPLRIGKVA